MRKTIGIVSIALSAVALLSFLSIFTTKKVNKGFAKTYEAIGKTESGSEYASHSAIDVGAVGVIVLLAILAKIRKILQDRRSSYG
jgi:hypothetical protein